MRLLFLKLKHIGDTLLLTPTLVAARTTYPEAEIWVGVRQGCESILAGCSGINRIVTFAAPEPNQRSRFHFLHDAQQLLDLRRQHFDFVFELTDGDRGRWLAVFSGARTRVTSRLSLEHRRLWQSFFPKPSPYDWTHAHRVEKDFYTVAQALPLSTPIPSLQFQAEPNSLGLIPESIPYVVLHPATRWQRKRWAESNWIEVGRQLQARGLQVIISTGPDPEEIALGQRLTQALPGAINTGGQLSWTQLAGLLRGAKLFVGVDTAAMHLAAATQTPIVALFGPTQIEAWRPWQVPHRLVTPPHPTQNDPHQMQHISVAAVLNACQTLLN